MPIDLCKRLATTPFLTLDGGLSNQVEAQGAALNTHLWSAHLLLDDPQQIKRAHRAYFDAGADIAITASYQASLEGFQALGLASEQARELIKRSVRLAREAADESRGGTARGDTPLLVAGSIGPYGAYLADGSEYSGDYALSDQALMDFHRPRLDALLEAGVDLLAIETQPSSSEVAALAELLREYPEARAWVSFSARDGATINDGTPIEQCAAWLEREPQVVALGINCTPPEFISPLLRRLAEHTCKPLVVYPNSGERYDAHSKAWRDDATANACHLSPQVREWYALGARLIGGCCRTTPTDIAAIAAQRDAFS